MPRWGPPSGPPPTAPAGVPPQGTGTFPPPPINGAPGMLPVGPSFPGSGPYTDPTQGPRPPPPPSGQFPQPSQPVMPPPNPGPQTMMNMGFVPTPISDSPAPGFPGVAGQPMQPPMPGGQPMGHAQMYGPGYGQPVPRFGAPGTTPAGPHGQLPGQLPAPSGGQPPQSQSRRLDPDQMPSPV